MPLGRKQFIQVLAPEHVMILSYGIRWMESLVLRWHCGSFLYAFRYQRPCVKVVSASSLAFHKTLIAQGSSQGQREPSDV